MKLLESSISEKMKLFFQLTLVPIHLFSDNEHIISFAPSGGSFQKHFDWFLCEVIDSLKELSIKISLNLTNDLEESFIFAKFKIHANNYYVLCGPFIISTNQEDFINKLVLKRNELLNEKDELILSFSHTKFLEEKNSLLYKQLFNELFVYRGSNQTGEEDTLSDKFHIHRIENKEKLFSHPPYHIEQKLLVKIKEGNIKESQNIIQNLNTYHDAILSKNSIRSFKNSLICRCTLYTRAVIEGGVDSETAFTLSDLYINKVEELSDIEGLYNLDIKMISEFINLTKNRINRLYSPLVQSAIKVVDNSIRNKITVNDVADQIPANSNYLSQVFKKEVGIPLNFYINQRKVEEAKYFLSFTDRSLADISNVLQFSSQSHFTSVFKKQMGITPLKYRKDYKNSRNILQ